MIDLPQMGVGGGGIEGRGGEGCRGDSFSLHFNIGSGQVAPG